LLRTDLFVWGRRSRDWMVVGFTTTCAISAYHHQSCEFESCWWWCVLDTTLCDKVCQWLATDPWFSLATPVSSTNKTDPHYITEILLKVVLNTKTITLTLLFYLFVNKWENYGLLSYWHLLTDVNIFNVIKITMYIVNINSLSIMRYIYFAVCIARLHHC
jgi:hypothetical protein